MPRTGYHVHSSSAVRLFAHTFSKSQCTQRLELDLSGNQPDQHTLWLQVETAGPTNSLASNGNQPDQLNLWLQLSSLNSMPQRESLSEQQHFQQSYETSTLLADFNYKSPDHRTQPPTSNSKSSTSNTALCKWLSALPQNQRRQHPHICELLLLTSLVENTTFNSLVFLP
jgi:hypothetical protein